MGNSLQHPSTGPLVEILELLAILRTATDAQSKEYVFNELRKFFAAERPQRKRDRKAA